MRLFPGIDLSGLGDQSSAGKSADLIQIADFGPNPGNLSGYLLSPTGLPKSAPLVVLLHGCTQNARDYLSATGWAELARIQKFAVLAVEQPRENNANLCFNWFRPKDIRRKGGEAQSIADMVEATIVALGSDRSRIFVTGLSAGGAMTSAMLATHPDLFAGGAIIAGLPFGAAANVPQAFERMRGEGYDQARLVKAIGNASKYSGPWPKVSVWHGTTDQTVVDRNASLIIDQWRQVHRTTAEPVEERSGRTVHRSWSDPAGDIVIEEYRIDGMGHGVPLAVNGGEAVGTIGAYMLSADISSTWRIAESWGLIDPALAEKAGLAPAERIIPDSLAASAGTGFDPGKIINDALRSAGLLGR